MDYQPASNRVRLAQHVSMNISPLVIYSSVRKNNMVNYGFQSWQFYFLNNIKQYLDY